MVGQERFQDINQLLNARLAEKKVLIAVHRGSWGGSIIENTIPAYMAALQMGADMFEVDLARSTDGVLYAIHDTYEKRLLHREENIKTLDSAEIDTLEVYNCIDEPTGQRIQRFEQVLAHFTHGELFNVDRAWSILPEVDALMRQYPHAVQQAVIKTPVKEEYLEFFQNCPVKYMYMPICYSMDDVRKALSYPDINIVGVEAIAPSVDSDLYLAENLRWMKEQGLYVWSNAITLSNIDRHILSAGYDDNKSILEGPEAGWGVLMDQGYNVLQTDWPALLSSYRNKKFG